MEPRLRTLRGAFSRRRHTFLLIAIVSALTVRPLIGDAGAAPLVFSLVMLVLLLVALFTVRVDDLVGERNVLLTQRRRRKVIAWVLASLAVVERLLITVAPSAEILLLGTVTWLLFISFVTWSLVRNLLRHRAITGETISMSISIYLLLGMAWALLYVVVLQFQPDAIRFTDPDLALNASNEAEVLPVLLYFSLTTLTTVGFGDIAPVSLLARYLAVTEGIAGQFYLAILVARLVGLYMSQHESENHRNGATG